jgi:hypothetical protein
MAAFIYEPLQEPKRQIRLLSIRPGRKEDKVACSVSTHYLTDAPPYAAISYTWGAPTSRKRILVNEKRHLVQPNAREALWQARLHGQHGYIWIDSVCINQDDTIEKGHQIDFMRAINRNADRVLLSLAEIQPSLLSDATMRAQLRRALRTEGTFGSIEKGYQPRHARALASKLSLCQGREFARVIREISWHSYWSRVWTVPEVYGRSDNKVVLIADYTLSLWEVVRFAHAVRCELFGERFEGALSDISPHFEETVGYANIQGRNHHRSFARTLEILPVSGLYRSARPGVCRAAISCMAARHSSSGSGLFDHGARVGLEGRHLIFSLGRLELKQPWRFPPWDRSVA